MVEIGNPRKLILRISASINLHISIFHSFFLYPSGIPFPLGFSFPFSLFLPFSFFVYLFLDFLFSFAHPSHLWRCLRQDWGKIRFGLANYEVILKFKICQFDIFDNLSFETLLKYNRLPLICLRGVFITGIFE